MELRMPHTLHENVQLWLTNNNIKPKDVRVIKYKNKLEQSKLGI
jgi:hypothetical protein